MKKIKVLMDEYKETFYDGILASRERTGGKVVVEVEVVEEKKTSFTVKLADGNIITRSKKNDMPMSEVDKCQAL